MKIVRVLIFAIIDYMIDPANIFYQRLTLFTKKILDNVLMLSVPNCLAYFVKMESYKKMNDRKDIGCHKQ